jgi:hypothetical protein
MEAELTESEWRGRWEAERWFCQADGESGKRYGNETIRISPDGEVSIRLPAPLAHLANAPHGRYVLACTVRFAHRGGEWADRVAANRAIAYRIHLDTGRERWYLTASWQLPPTPTVPIEAALAHGVIGVDMNAFPSAKHLASWAGMCPGNDQSAGKRRSGRTRKGSMFLGTALEEAALAAIPSKGTYPAAQYQRLKPRIGHGRALGAVKHSMLVAYWHMFTTGETYHELGGDYYQRRDPQRITKRLIAKLQELGHTVTLEETAA